MTDSPEKSDRTGLAPLLAAASESAGEFGRPVLVSLSQPLAGIDPLRVLENLSRAAGSDDRIADLIEAGRMYWESPRDQFAIAGIGAVATFAPEGKGRFQAVDAAWSTFIRGAVIGDSDGGVSGPGPLLMGGFAFDPHTRQTGHWQGFSSAHTIVPRLALTSAGDDCWATISLLVGVDGIPDVDAESLTSVLSAALDSSERFDGLDSSIAMPSDVAFPTSKVAEQWRTLVETAVSAIRAGRLEKVVLAREERAIASRDLDVFAILRHLRVTHQKSFVFSYWRRDSAFLGATPERLVRLDGREIRASSLAGTAKRGTTSDEDAALSDSLLASAKDRAEHAAVRDALYESLSEICDDIDAADVPSLLTLPHLHHLHTPIRARLRDGHSLLEVVARLHPTPAVGGMPRDPALEFISEHEQLDRGWYAGPIGWMGRESGEFAVALRSAVVAGAEATLFAGCGIVADSNPGLEYNESVLKLVPMQSAIAASVGEQQPDLPEIVPVAELTG